MIRVVRVCLASFVSVLVLAGGAFAQPPATSPASPTPAKAEQPKKDGGAEQPKPATPPAATTPPPSAPAAPSQPETKPLPDFEFLKMSTSKGDIYLKLNRAKAPISVANFLKYVDMKFYDGTIFHRVMKDFMIQGGGFTPDMKQKKTEPSIKNEWQNGLKNKRGTISMARTQIADSATSQFFINVKDNEFLDQPRDGAAYAVFGEVVVGMDVVDAIQNVKTTEKGGMRDVPAEGVTINSVTKITEEDAKKAGAK